MFLRTVAKSCVVSGESLAMKYRYAFNAIREVTGKTYNTIHMLGGGTKDRLLCQMTADSCNVKEVVLVQSKQQLLVILWVQLIALNEISGLKEARKIVKDSVEPKEYDVKDAASYDAAYSRF